MMLLGSAIEKTELQVKKELDCYLVRIYTDFEMFDEAYDALCIQAEYSSWLHSTFFEDIIKKSGHWLRLKEILEKRVNPTGKSDYTEALQKLKSMGY